MTSAKFWDFLTPFPPCPHLGLIYSTKFTQPPLLHLLLGKPPLSVDVIYGCPLKVLTLDLEKHLGPDLEEALFVAVDFMYFKEMMDVPSEMLFKVLRVAKCLNVVKVLESACALLNPATSEEWLCLYNTSRADIVF